MTYSESADHTLRVTSQVNLHYRVRLNQQLSYTIEKDIRTDVETVWENSKFLPWKFTLRTLYFKMKQQLTTVMLL